MNFESIIGINKVSDINTLVSSFTRSMPIVYPFISYFSFLLIQIVKGEGVNSQMFIPIARKN